MQDGLSVEALELWRGDKRLARDLCFNAAPGALVRIAGLNGSGKTTLLRAICGLTYAEKGTISWTGINIHKDLGSYHADLAWLGHRDGLKPELSVRENLALHQRMQGRHGDSLEQLIDRAGIAQFANLDIRSLSAGQKRRVAFCRVIHSGVRLWLLDEPFANLDTAGQQWGLARIREHVATGGTCILSTHLSFDESDVVTVELSA